VLTTERAIPTGWGVRDDPAVETAAVSMTRRIALGLGVLAVPVGIAVELVGAVPLPLLDLASGLVMASAAVVLALNGRPRSGIVVACAALAWFAGTVSEELVWAHRAVLATAVLGAPDARLTTRRSQLAVATAWLCVLPAVPANYGVVVTAAAAAAARPRSLPVVAFAAAVVWVPFVRHLAPGATDATLAVYDVVITIPVLLLAFDAVRARRTVARTVVELSAAGGITGVERALGDAIGDPTLRLGRWSDTQQAFVDGSAVMLATPSRDLIPVPIERDGAPFALLLHSTGTLADERLRDAVVQAARLGIENAELQRELETKAGAVRASRRRLVETATRQRALLARRLEAGPGRLLASLEPAVTDLPTAAGLLAGVRGDFELLGRGLLPANVEAGDLRAALEDIARASALPVAVDADVRDVGRETAAALYFVAAEAVANAARHAGATCARIVVSRDDERVVLEVSDDGSGGADPSGRGLQGLRDRLEALGGGLAVISERELGTRLRAELPLK
jgi:signal transduction histidine kinase